MKATNPSQFDAWTSKTLPEADEIRPGIWSVPLPMGNGHLPYSLGYVIEDGSGAVHIIDPGWTSDENWRVMTTALNALNHTIADVATITATHLHPDHLGMADRLRAATGAPVIMHVAEQHALRGMVGRAPGEGEGDELTAWGVPAERRAELRMITRAARLPQQGDADIVVADGDLLPIPGRTVRVIHTPGHTPGHICLREERERLILTGDHVLPKIHPGIGLGGPTISNPIADYLASLAAVSAFDDDEVGPGHEYRFTGLAERCARIADHHLRRSREVAETVKDDAGASVWQIASGLTWTAGWNNLNGFSRISALSQTAMHLDFVQSEAAGAHL